MGCCGQNRAALSRQFATRSNTTPSAIGGSEPTPAIVSPPVRLHYMQASAILVRGPVTGRIYQFSAAQPDSNVDSRDVAALVRSGLFRQIS